MEFGEIINNKQDGTIDFKNCNLAPTTTLPLLCLSKSQNLKLRNGEGAFEFLKKRLDDDILFSELPKSRIESDESDFISKYMENLESEYGGYFSLRIIISELANNVYDHSREDNEEVQSL